jgi:putative hydrolase of the HAD superfamily
MPIPRGAVRGVSFDYGHVLGGLDFLELASRIGAEGSAVVVDAMRGALVDAYRAHDEGIARGLGHERAWHMLMATLVRASGRIADEHLDATIGELWRAQPTRNLWRFVPDEARGLLDALRAASVPLVVTSNSEGRARELLTECGIADAFVVVLDSGVLGFAKPDRRIFDLAAKHLELPLSSIVHVGDSETADVVGAKNAGAFAIRFDAFVPGSAAQPTVADARAADYPTLRHLLGDALAVSL